MDICSIVTLVGVLGCLGEATTHLTKSMAALRPVIRRWAVALGIVTAVVSFFVLFGSRIGSPDDVLAVILGSGVIGVGAAAVWYLVVAVLAFLFQYLVAAPFRFLCGSSILPVIGIVLGFVAGVVHLGMMLENRSNPGSVGAFILVGAYSIGGAMAPWCIRWFFRLLGTVVTWAMFVGGKVAGRYQDFAERRRTQAEADEREAIARRNDAATQPGREAARKHLNDFCHAHEELLVSAFPSALMEAFIACEMSDTLSPAQLWAVCHRKIAELQPIILQEQAKKKADEERVKKRNIRIKQIDAEIRTCQEKIARLASSGQDLDFIEDETHGLLMKIRQLEEQKELLSTLGEMVDS
jgi:hypothetical protein